MPKYPSPRSSTPAPVGRTDALLDRAKQAKLAGNRDEAVRLYHVILGVDPLNFEAMVQLGASLADDGQLGAALGLFDDSLRIDPTQPLPWVLRGVALEKLGYMLEALRSYERVMELRPNDVQAQLARASVLFNLGQFAESVAVYDRTASIALDKTEHAINRAAALHACGRTAEALLEYDRAIAMDPSSARAHLQKAFVLLLVGDLRRGFDVYEWRHKMPEVIRFWRKFSEPLWLGETGLAGKTLLLYHEQGLGDTIQFCRYATLAANAGAKVILDVPEPLAELMKTVVGVSQIVVEGQPVPNFDLRCPLMSLPRAFCTTPETIPGDVPYLYADSRRAAAWRERLHHLEGHRVGLVWGGSSRRGNAALVGTDQRRSLPLMALAPLASVAQISFLSLQLGPPAAQTAEPPTGMILHDHTSELKSFADTAALIENLDLVISVDTSIAHLAGAMGKPVWLLNRYDTCWRWFLDRTDSPWYPTMRIFRQPQPSDWDSVIRSVTDALRAFAAT